jgi:hypothetical protein
MCDVQTHESCRPLNVSLSIPQLLITQPPVFPHIFVAILAVPRPAATLLHQLAYLYRVDVRPNVPGAIARSVATDPHFPQTKVLSTVPSRHLPSIRPLCEDVEIRTAHRSNCSGLVSTKSAKSHNTNFLTQVSNQKTMTRCSDRPKECE